MKEQNYNLNAAMKGVTIKMWTRGVPVEDGARAQLAQAAQLPIVFKHIAAMPDVHYGIGATVGSVIPTFKAIIPAAVGVDIGCGMMACKTTLHANDLPDNLGPLRSAIEKAVPHGSNPKRMGRDKGSWETPPDETDAAWAKLVDEFDAICEDYPRIKNTNNHKHLGTLGTGNHFIEVCLDEAGSVCSCCTRVRVAWATRSARTSSNSRRRTPSSISATCPTRTWRTSRKAPGTSATTCARWAGPRSSRVRTAR